MLDTMLIPNTEKRKLQDFGFHLHDLLISKPKLKEILEARNDFLNNTRLKPSDIKEILENLVPTIINYTSKQSKAPSAVKETWLDLRQYPKLQFAVNSGNTNAKDPSTTDAYCNINNLSDFVNSPMIVKNPSKTNTNNDKSNPTVSNNIVINRF
jgi:hypothetical protein